MATWRDVDRPGGIGLLARIRAWASQAGGTLLEQQRWREYYAALDDPSLANLVDRFLCRTPRAELRLVRPLRLSWQCQFGTERVVRAFVLAAAMSLCQAVWLVPCARCRFRTVLRGRLEPVVCLCCREPLLRSPNLPAEMVFHHLREPLRQGRLPPDADAEGAEDLAPVAVRVPPRAPALLFPRAVSRVVTLRARHRGADGPDGHGPEVCISIALDLLGPERLAIDPVSYAGSSAVLGKGRPMVVRNGHDRLVMEVRLDPLRDAGRIGEHSLRGVEEAADIFG